mmetsp:Transcript_20156/g.59542  ORF Transcript_20156/g.59542 Transcript_20156/m.59542 type:complete len:330 (-) Transcript_20156:496-1485(-)
MPARVRRRRVRQVRLAGAQRHRRGAPRGVHPSRPERRRTVANLGGGAHPLAAGGGERQQRAGGVCVRDPIRRYGAAVGAGCGGASGDDTEHRSGEQRAGRRAAGRCVRHELRRPRGRASRSRRPPPLVAQPGGRPRALGVRQRHRDVGRGHTARFGAPQGVGAAGGRHRPRCHRGIAPAGAARARGQERGPRRAERRLVRRLGGRSAAALQPSRRAGGVRTAGGGGLPAAGLRARLGRREGVGGGLPRRLHRGRRPRWRVAVHFAGRVAWRCRVRGRRGERRGLRGLRQPQRDRRRRRRDARRLLRLGGGRRRRRGLLGPVLGPLGAAA